MRYHKYISLATALILCAVAVAACSTGVPEPTATAEPEPTNVPATPFEAPTDPPEPASEETGGEVTYAIDPERSEARFLIGEVLRGQYNLVVGATSQVEGEIQVDWEVPANSTLGTITISADSFRTDNGFRDGAISDFILNSGSYPQVTFEPLSVEGLPAQVAVGESVPLVIEGTLTIRDLSQPVTFQASVTLLSNTELEGNATASISRSDFGLRIPSVPQVASVEEELQLELDFVAVATDA